MSVIGSNQIYRHNPDDNTWNILAGKESPSLIDLVARHESGEPFLYKSTIIDTDAQIPDNNDFLRARHVCFSQVGVFNRTQGTGLLPVTVRTDNPDNENDVQNRLRENSMVVEANYANSQWRLNDLDDHVKSMNGKVTYRDCDCNPRLELYDQGEQLEGLANLKDRYLVYRFVWKSLKNVQMYFKSVITQIDMQSE